MLWWVELWGPVLSTPGSAPSPLINNSLLSDWHVTNTHILFFSTEDKEWQSNAGTGRKLHWQHTKHLSISETWPSKHTMQILNIRGEMGISLKYVENIPKYSNLLLSNNHLWSSFYIATWNVSTVMPTWKETKSIHALTSLGFSLTLQLYSSTFPIRGESAFWGFSWGSCLFGKPCSAGGPFPCSHSVVCRS